MGKSIEIHIGTILASGFAHFAHPGWRDGGPKNQPMATGFTYPLFKN